MELLKFNDAPKSARRGKNPAGFIGAGIMVAVMGLSSTLAGTITIGTAGTVEFGQGVVNTAACDSTITVTPASSYSYAEDTFTVSSITVSGIGGLNTNPATGRGCLGQVLEFRAYNESGELLDFNNGAYALTIAIPSVMQITESSTAFVIAGFNVDGNGNVATSQVGLFDATVTENVPGSGDNQGFNNPTTSATGAGSFVIGGLTLNSRVTRITIESRAPRANVDPLETPKTSVPPGSA